jgi:hypothetical protein
MNEIFDQPCCVSGEDCNAPAGYQSGSCDYKNGFDKNKGARLICFACGCPVCENCSSVYDYYDYGKKIICDNCTEDNDLVKPKISNFVKPLTKNITYDNINYIKGKII